VFLNAFPVLRKYGYPGTAFVITGNVGESAYVSWDQLQRMRRAGWEIGSHTVNHPYLPKLSHEQIEYELKVSRDWLESEGFGVFSFASPYGEYDETTLELVREIYAAHRTAGPEAGLNPMGLEGDEHYNLKVVATTSKTTVEEVCKWIRKAKEKGAWLILTFHFIGGEGLWHWGIEQLDQVAQCVQDHGCTVVTVREGVERDW